MITIIIYLNVAVNLWLKSKGKGEEKYEVDGKINGAGVKEIIFDSIVKVDDEVVLFLPGSDFGGFYTFVFLAGTAAPTQVIIMRPYP